MFAAIETNGATHIIIHVPHQGSEKSLPSLASMLEQNATFVRSGYSEFSTVKPNMTIVLGDSYKIDRSEEELIVHASSSVLGDEFVIATPDVFVSNSKAMKKKDEELSRQRTEISFLKQQLESLKSQIEELVKTEVE